MVYICCANALRRAVRWMIYIVVTPSFYRMKQETMAGRKLEEVLALAQEIETVTRSDRGDKLHGTN